MADSFNCQKTLNVQNTAYHYYDLEVAQNNGLTKINQLPKSLKILLENVLRHENGTSITDQDAVAFQEWLKTQTSTHEIAYHPARVLMQDFTGVPAVVDLAAMRDAKEALGGDPQSINPHCPVDLVIDHSVQVDRFGSKEAFATNVQMEMQRNHERYSFLKWGQQAFKNFRVVPPGTGICHQVNLEYLAQTVFTAELDGKHWAYPDTLVGTDSHTTMINALGVLGWGVGGIEAEAAMLGQAISMRIPDVVGFELTGQLNEGITATDLVLTITQRLRAQGVVGKFVEFYGDGLHHLPLADRATISNMAPEYGATCGFFPIDQETLNYLTLSGRDPETIARVEAYAKAQGLWHDASADAPLFTETLTLDLSTVEPSLAGPKRPQDRVPLAQLKQATEAAIQENPETDLNAVFATDASYDLHHGDVVIAAITSCTNTSNPSVMLAAGLVAQKALSLGLQVKPWVKTSLAPGSKVVTDYLVKTNLLKPLEDIGFFLVGYGCTTCIGNSGPLDAPVAKAIDDGDIVASSVLSGNRNFEGRVHPQVKTNWLASPPLVVAYALAGTTRINLNESPLGKDRSGHPVYLKDIWPTTEEVSAAVNQVNQTMFTQEYSAVFEGDDTWKAIEAVASNTYSWDGDSTYVKNPPFFTEMTNTPDAIRDIENARILALLGDSVTTDHISPAGAIKIDSPAGHYLKENGVDALDFNSYGSRRGNHEVMMRGTFANIRIRNEMLPGVEGGFTKVIGDDTPVSIYDAAMQYQSEGVPLVVIAGKEYGTGSSRDWAAKGTLLLGIKAVISESFERIHRSNLIGMGVLPLVFPEGITRHTLKLVGDEKITLQGLQSQSTPPKTLAMTLVRSNGDQESIELLCRIDTVDEWHYFQHGGILKYVLRQA